MSGSSQVPAAIHNARALARHVQAAVLHLRQAERIAEAAGIDLDASEHEVPEAGLFRAAGDAAQDLDLWASNSARVRGASPAGTYQHTERWCHAPGGALSGGSWPAGPPAGGSNARQASGEVRVRMPGSAVLIDYASQCERDRSLRLAEARQVLAERGCFLPAWGGLSEHDREIAAVEARNWLRAGIADGLIPACPLHDDCRARR